MLENRKLVKRSDVWMSYFGAVAISIGTLLLFLVLVLEVFPILGIRLIPEGGIKDDLTVTLVSGKRKVQKRSHSWYE